jgi:small subunit ribosomal protein S7
MARKKRAEKRIKGTDPLYNSPVVSAIINKVLRKGKKTIAEKIVYDAMSFAAEKIGRPAMDVLTEAINNVKPIMEVKSRRVGGANYQVPIEVREDRAVTLAIKWIVEYAKDKKGKPMVEKLGSEFIDAYNKTGASIKKREDTHKMAEANKAFAHFRW